MVGWVPGPAAMFYRAAKVGWVLRTRSHDLQNSHVRLGSQDLRPCFTEPPSRSPNALCSFSPRPPGRGRSWSWALGVAQPGTCYVKGQRNRPGPQWVSKESRRKPVSGRTALPVPTASKWWSGWVEGVQDLPGHRLALGELQRTKCLRKKLGTTFTLILLWLKSPSIAMDRCCLRPPKVHHNRGISECKEDVYERFWVKWNF